MIDGFKVTVAGYKLHQHLEARAEHHKKRATFYATEVERLGASEAVAGSANYADPRQACRNAQDGHDKKAQLFRFYADNLDRAESYHLSKYEVDELELLK